jgi:hypothetical protein
MAEEQVTQQTTDEQDFYDAFGATYQTDAATEPRSAESTAPEASQQTADTQESVSEQTADTQESVSEQPPADPGLPLSAFDEQTIKTLLAKSAKVDALEEAMTRQAQELRRAYGKIGELNSHLKQLMQAPTKRGIRQIELKFNRLEQEYPELAELLKEDLAAALSVAQEEVDAAQPAQSTETPQQSAEQSTETPQQSAEAPSEDALRERELALRAEYEARLLSAKHPDWQQIAASSDFNIWLASQPPQVQQVARTSWSAEELSAVLDLYKTSVSALSERTKAATQSVRQRRLETAVPAAGTESAAPPMSSELDEFLAGFQSVMKQRLY